MPSLLGGGHPRGVRGVGGWMVRALEWVALRRCGAVSTSNLNDLEAGGVEGDLSLTRIWVPYSDASSSLPP